MKTITLKYRPYNLITHSAGAEQTIYPVMLKRVIKLDNHYWISWIDSCGNMLSDYCINLNVMIMGKSFSTCSDEFYEALTTVNEYNKSMKVLDTLD